MHDYSDTISTIHDLLLAYYSYQNDPRCIIIIIMIIHNNSHVIMILPLSLPPTSQKLQDSINTEHGAG